MIQQDEARQIKRNDELRDAIIAAVDNVGEKHYLGQVAVQVQVTLDLLVDVEADISVEYEVLEEDSTAKSVTFKLIEDNTTTFDIEETLLEKGRHRMSASFWDIHELVDLAEDWDVTDIDVQRVEDYEEVK